MYLRLPLMSQYQYQLIPSICVSSPQTPLSRVDFPSRCCHRRRARLARQRIHFVHRAYPREKTTGGHLNTLDIARRTR